MAFQIQDDLLDFVGQEKELGKPVGQDIRQGIYSLPVICLLENQDNDSQLKDLLASRNLSQDRLTAIYRQIKDREILDDVSRLSKRYFSRADSFLSKLPPCRAREVFSSWAFRMNGADKMTSFQLKLIAMTTMLVDHVGAVIYPDILGYRIIGRLAFPLFAFLITEGYRQTSSYKIYLLRLSIFSVISQYPFWLAFGFDSGLNIFFTLALGLLAIYLADHYQDFLPVIILAGFAELISTDYGMFGVLLIYLVHLYRDEFNRMLLYLAGLYGAFYLLGGLLIQLPGDLNPLHYYIQPFALLSFIFIKYYNGSQGLGIKYLFYLFYPLHLLLLGMI